MNKLERWQGIIPPEELAAYRKAALGSKIGLGERVALINVDSHNLFVDPRYALGAELPRVVEALTRLTALFRELELPIYYVRRDDWSHHVKRGVRNFRFQHLNMDTDKRYAKDAEADEWPAAYAPTPDDVIVYKNKPSAFFGTPLEAWLRYDRVDSLVICGISTSGCVRATVNDAFAHNFRILVPEEACGDRGPTAHRMNLFDMDMKYADVEPLEEAIAELRRRFGPARAGASHVA